VRPRGHNPSPAFPILGPTPLPESGYATELALPGRRAAFLASQRATVLVSADGGRKWRNAIPWGAALHPSAFQSEGYRTIRFLDRRHGWVVGVDGELVTTADGGRRWTLVQPGYLSETNKAATPGASSR
jgi:photosystem II stability/assembly factor-like uncharacterized protein